MTHARARDELGAEAWRGTRWGLLGVTRPAREARESGDPVSIANARNAVNHVWSFVVAIVAVAVLVPLVLAIATDLVGGRQPSAVVVAWATFGAIVAVSVGSLAAGFRGVRAAERGEVYRAPQTIPFTR